MQHCREKALQLDQRLASVREQIEAWDQKEVEWQRRVSRRLRILWAVMGTALLLAAIMALVGVFKPDSIPGRVQIVGRLRTSAEILHANTTSGTNGLHFTNTMARDSDVPCFHEVGAEGPCQGSRFEDPSERVRRRNPEEKIQRVLDEL